MSKVENLQTINRAKPFPCVSVALAVLAMFVLSWLAAKGVRNNLQTLLIFAGLCSPIFIAELRNHHNKWAIIVFNAVPVITYAFGYLVLSGPVLTGSMVLWLAGFGVSICIWFAALVWACTRVRPTMSAAQGAEGALRRLQCHNAPGDVRLAVQARAIAAPIKTVVELWLWPWLWLSLTVVASPGSS